MSQLPCAYIISVYTVTFNTKQTVLFSNPGLVYTEHVWPSCLQPGGGVPCQTLEFVQSQLKSVSSGSVKIEICQPGVNLTKPLNFTDMIDFSIAGEDSSSYVRILCNKSGAGLVFMNGTGLSLTYLWMFSCGAELNTSDTDFTRVAAMHIIDCWNISITNTLVKSSNGLIIGTFKSRWTTLCWWQ